MAKIRLYSAELSRRNVLQHAAAVAVGMTGVAATASNAFAAKPKKSQADVAYQDHPHGTEKCDNCEPFIAPDQCRTVVGPVSAQGWCKIYVEK